MEASSRSELGPPVRHLIVVLGDQLDPRARPLVALDPARDCLWMAEVTEESTHVWSHKARSTLFLAAMRHFRDACRQAGRPLVYHRLGHHPHGSLAGALGADLARLRPERVILTRPGDHRVFQSLTRVCETAGVPLEIREDAHFLVSLETFRHWAGRRKQTRLEHFYRHVREQLGVLMEDGEPAGGRWNFDTENRKPLPRAGPGMLPAPLGFEPDALTREAMADVERHFPDHPGSLASFDWPVSPEQARAALEDFIDHRLPAFGPYQDALWTGEPWLYHARISAALNLKLISPREVIEAAEAAWREGRAPLASVEGFIRQVLGWREYVRGLYWQHMPEWLEWNALEAGEDLPGFYWTGETDMRCLAETLGQTLKLGYAHHIQRLMVTGLFAQLLGVRPRALHEWYLAVYVDAVEWVELPNTLGMSQYTDGGRMASKPYVASGQYIKRMSNYCEHCRYRPDEALGEQACPFTTLYWDFLDRHRARFSRHPRTALQWRNLDRLSPERLAAIRRKAQDIRTHLTGDPT
ncbi:cryptochrome/photolyase family protein [Thioalkalivibrio sulfidiphilus]|uniref:cryptochrome/photolyase family protein n=1 Tax=Thioalkalivibrio sulfidiphilus TaxID=1033854 RepID=UPI003BB0E3D9